jgi:hypothetical protein
MKNETTTTNNKTTENILLCARDLMLDYPTYSLEDAIGYVTNEEGLFETLFAAIQNA